MNRPPSWVTQVLASVRVVVVMTVVVGLAYPLAVTALAQLPGLQSRANGSLVTAADGSTVGSRLIGQSFTAIDGTPLEQYFQTRPSAAGDGYDPTATGASNLGPESIVDVLPDPALAATLDGDPNAKPSLLTRVCGRSLAIGELESVDGSRLFCTMDGVGAVLGVFRADGLTGRAIRVVSLNQACPGRPFVARFEGVEVECAKFGEDYSDALVVPVRGDAPAPAVPPDAVTASASGLDPHISPAYARLQADRVAHARGISIDTLMTLVREHTDGRSLGFLGQPAVNVVTLNLALDRDYPVKES